MVSHQLQASFTGGEVSPSLYMRADAASYHTWLKQAQNMIVHQQGGISNRAGTQYVGSGKSGQTQCRLIAFPITAQEGYVLELGNQYIRFFMKNGPVLDGQGNVLELSTPYAQADLSEIRVAQYNQMLFLAHRKYPLMQLVRISVGVFRLQEAALHYGPFMPANTDEEKQLRLCAQTTTVQSEGVAANVTFSPVNYPNLMVWAYFNGDCFYAGERYGLYLDDIADNFNLAYQDQGLHASAQGDILRITSAVTDGGNWNGATFVLEYRSRFTGEADYTFTQTLSGGENAGTQSVAQPGRFILQSNFDCFTPGHVGGMFNLIHTADANYQTGTLGYETVGPAIASCGDWSLRTTGNWTGNISVEVSYDNQQTWQVHKTLTRTEQDDNFYLTGNLNEPENMLYIRLRSGQNSGDTGYELASAAFIQRGVVKVIGYISARQVIVEQERLCVSDTWTSKWAEGSFSPAAGYPSCVFIYQDRLGLAATQAEPQTLWFSKTGSWMDFGRARDTLLSTDSLSVRLGSTQLDAITAVLVLQRLLIFTVGSEWTLSCNGALSLDTMDLAKQSERGSYSTAPILVGNRAIFVQARGGVIRDFVYDYATASYTGDDLTLRAKHLFANQVITHLAYAQEPDSLLWCLSEKGKLLSLTYVPEQGIYAWTHHQTQGTFVSLCTLQDEVWVAVLRAGKLCVERMVKRSWKSVAENGGFLDSSVLAVHSQPSAYVDGLAHLEGQTVCAVADGNVFRNLTVENASLQLPHAAGWVQVGLPYEAFLETLPVSNGVTSARKQRYVSACIHVLDSRGGWVGTERDALTEFVQRTHEAYNAAVSLQTGPQEVLLAMPHTYQPGVWVMQKDPLPLTILCIGVKSA